MERKNMIWWGMFIGSTLGAFIPSLWGASAFDLSGVFLTAIGGAIGIWVGYTFGD